MVNKDVARVDGPGAKRTTHDRKPSADIGYRVWNLFAAELRIDTGDRHDEIVKAFTVADVLER
jgi:hypothetical protein